MQWLQEEPVLLIMDVRCGRHMMLRRVKWKRRVRKIEEHEEMLQMAKSGTVPDKANNTGKSGKYHTSNSSDSKQNATTAVGAT